MISFMGISDPLMGLWALLGVCSGLVLAGTALVAWMELRSARIERSARGATRLKRQTGQRGGVSR